MHQKHDYNTEYRILIEKKETTSVHVIWKLTLFIPWFYARAHRNKTVMRASNRGKNDTTHDAHSNIYQQDVTQWLAVTIVTLQAPSFLLLTSTIC